MSPAHRWLIKSARTVHLYVTLSGVVLLAFFAVTGFILNHEDWFGFGVANTRTATGHVPTALLAGPDKLGIVELLRKDFAAKGVLDSFEEEEDSLRLAFTQPGRRVEAVIQRSDGSMELTYDTRGFFGVIADLHRGKSTGTAWSLVIDGVCILVLVVSATGLYLWSSLKGRGHYGWVVLVLGLLFGLLVYFAFVP